MTASSTRIPGDAARFVERFAEAWAGPHADQLLDLLHPQVRLVQPMCASTADRAAAETGFFRALCRFLPDLRLAVVHWSAVGDTLFIEWTASATLARRPIRWSGVDRFLLADGRATERVAYFDSVPLLLAVLARPSCWVALWRSGAAGSLLRAGKRTA